MAKSKVIIKKDLLNVMAKVRKYRKAETEEESDKTWVEWYHACKETFGDMSKKRPDILKNLTFHLVSFDNKTVIKVFQALGYEVVDNWADYMRNQRKKVEESVYDELCNGCSKEKYCW